MQLNRQKFLDDLNMVRPGLSPREHLEQSSCFIFADQHVITFNEEISCRKPIDFKLSGAVPASSLLAVLEKIQDTDLNVLDDGQGQIQFQGKHKRFWLNRSVEILLPYDRVEKPSKWSPLPEEFAGAVAQLEACVSTNEAHFILTCIHITPDFVEACDNRQLLRYKLEMPVKNDLVVRGAALVQIMQLGMTEISVTEGWIHFRNKHDLVISCRKYTEEFPDMSGVLEFKGVPITLPKSLIETSERATIFAEQIQDTPFLEISILPGKMRISGSGITGGYEEIKRIGYEGPPLKFFIPPKILAHLADKYTDARIAPEKLKAIQKGVWEYVTVLGMPDDRSSETGDNESE